MYLQVVSLIIPGNMCINVLEMVDLCKMSFYCPYLIYRINKQKQQVIGSSSNFFKKELHPINFKFNHRIIILLLEPQTFVRCFLHDRNSTSVQKGEHRLRNPIVPNPQSAVPVPFIFRLRDHWPRAPQEGAIHVSKEGLSFGITNHVHTIRWVHFTGEKRQNEQLRSLIESYFRKFLLGQASLCS